MDSLPLDQASLLLKFRFPPRQFRFYRSYGGGASFFFHHIVRLRINRQTHVTLLDRPKQRIDLRKRFNFVAKHFDAIRIVVVGGINFDDIAAHPKSTAPEVAFGALVENFNQLASDVPALDLLSLFEEQQHPVVSLRRTEPVDAADRSNDQTVAPLKKRPRRREPQLVELIIYSGFFLDIKVRRRHISLRLVEVVVRDEVFDGIVREEVFELVIELGGQRLVVGHDEGGAVGRLDHLGCGEGLARSGDAEQDLMLLAIEDAADEGVDGSSLIALGFVVANQLEVHNSLYGRDMGGQRSRFECTSV